MNTSDIESLNLYTGRAIRNERVKRKLSQEKLADLLGLSTQTVKNIEKGKGMKFETLIQISLIFAINLTDLLPHLTPIDQRHNMIALLSALVDTMLNGQHSDINSVLATRIKVYRLITSTTIISLAASSGVSEDIVKRIESGMGAKLDDVVKIAYELKIPFIMLTPFKSETLDSINSTIIHLCAEMSR